MSLAKIKHKFNSKFARNFLAYLSSGTIANIIPMIVLPIIANYLLPEELGKANNFMVLAQIFTPFILLKQDSYFQAYYYKKNEDDRREITSSILVVSVSMLTILSLILFLCKGAVEEYLKIPYDWAKWSVILSFGMAVFNLMNVILRFSENAKGFVKLQIGYALLLAGLNLLLIVFLGFDWTGRVIAWLVTGVVFTILIMFYLYQQGTMSTRFNLATTKETLLFSIPLVPQAITPVLRKASDKIFITNFIGLSLNGIYSIALSFSSAFDTLVNAFYSAYLPRLYKLLAKYEDEGNAVFGRKVVNESYISIVLCTIVLFIGYLAVKILVVYFLDESYHEMLLFLPFVMLDVLLRLINNLQVQIIYHSGKTLKLGSSIFIIGILHILLSYILVQFFDVYGVILALLIANSIRLVIVTRIMLSQVKLPWLYFIK